MSHNSAKANLDAIALWQYAHLRTTGPASPPPARRGRGVGTVVVVAVGVMLIVYAARMARLSKAA